MLVSDEAGNKIPKKMEIFCDGYRDCRNNPDRAPWIMVPNKGMLGFPFGVGPEYRPLRIRTTLHFCLLHMPDNRKLLDALLNTKLRTDAEGMAKHARPIDFKPDFDNAYVQWILTTTPEYREFLIEMGAIDVVV